MARFYPHVTCRSTCSAMLAVMAVGCAMILAMSSLQMLPHLRAQFLSKSISLKLFQTIPEMLVGHTIMVSRHKASCRTFTC